MYVPSLRFLYYTIGVTGLTIFASTFYMVRHVINGSQLLRGRTVSIFSFDRLFTNRTVYDPRASIYGGRAGEPRKESCVSCFRLPFKPVINANEICRVRDGQGIDMLLMITSTQERRKHRDMIRRTWASITRNNTANVRHVFLFGRQGTKLKNDFLHEEAVQYNDIVVGNFRDSYRNLTIKTLMGLKWVTNHCSNSKYIFKTDDDMWLSVPKILEIPKKFDLRNSLAGMCLEVGWPHRNKGSKWYASYISYPGATYPGFCTGTAYLMTTKTAKAVVKISPHVPFFHLEDVYVALCIKRLRYKLVNVPGFYNMKADFDPCKYQSEVITSHYVTTDDIERAWTKNCTVNESEPANVVRLPESLEVPADDSNIKIKLGVSDHDAKTYLMKSDQDKIIGKVNIAEIKKSKMAASFFKLSSGVRNVKRPRS
ncbi:beta-1,3-galactosyltransferase 1-like [Lineus longissimus]|uniref:beta-1,3-galactosyltransferase 1-like n=1 Tax=Lineus longissimus TaxID=88925 RepID=UPI00315D5F3F